MNIRHYINLVEAISGRKFYHGSFDELPVGTILKPQEGYEDRWSGVDFYAPLEKYRPQGMLAHKDAVFMCDNPDDIDNAGGGAEWLFTVEPLGEVQRHDLNWGSEISLLMEDPKANHVAIKKAAENYWNGVPHTDENVWEYLTPAARIIAVEEY